MSSMKMLLTAGLISMQLAGGTTTCQAASESAGDTEKQDGPAVKKSRAGICHLRGTAGYERTQRYEAFTRIELCVESGGRPLKGTNAPAAALQDSKPDLAVFDTDDPRFVRRSRGGICYDASDGTYLQLLYFRAYRSMQDCLESGGRKPDDSAAARN
jgi:hypothetical protein